eukprot:GHVP01052765.1.p1 GENE.GHVP01052765.1~~GHVP01052765.1.p1  ORF type:complete len:219 (+),score=24.18 GHVP01052765.1:409-1065(+)
MILRVMLWTILGISGTVFTFLPAFRKANFRLDDETLLKEMKKTSYPTAMIAFPCILFPISIICSSTTKKICCGMLQLFLTINLFAFAILNILKNCFGHLRPYFLTVCKPDSKKICTGKPSLIKEARKSFPSGHTAHIVLSMGFLIFLTIRNRLTFLETKLQKAVYILFLLCIIITISFSRILDNYHHPKDVMAGAGISVFFILICPVLEFYELVKIGG